jgi:hypothetical protein
VIPISATQAGRKTALRSAACGLAVVAFALIALASPALAGPPSHPPTPANDITDLDRACGAAFDDQGDAYAASPGAGVVKVFSPTDHSTPLAMIANSNDPCGLGVDRAGRLYVLEQATGDVIRYTPDSYPFEGAPSYGPPETISADGEALGIAVDPADDWLYVVKESRIDTYDPSGHLGIDEVQQLGIFSSSGGGFHLALPGDGGPGRNEMQRIAQAPDKYTLSFEGQATGTLKADATAAQVKEALESLSTIAPGEIAVSGFANRDKWVEFTGAKAETDVVPIEAKLVGSEEEVEVVAVSDISGQIPYGAPAATVEEALESLEGIGAGGVAVSAEGDGYRFGFRAGLAHTNVAQLAANPSGLIPDGSSFNPQAISSTSTEGFDGHLGTGELSEANAVAAYTYGPPETPRHYIFAGEPEAVQVLTETGIKKEAQESDIRKLAVRRTIDGAGFPDQVPAGGFELGALAADPGNCPPDAHACGAGHLFLYDEAHEALLEFEANGAFLDRVELGPGFEAAQPSAIAIERSGGPGDGTLYLSEGAGAGARVFAFGPLAPPSRSEDEDLSQTLAHARAVAVDSHGNLFAAADSVVYVFGPGGEPITQFEDPEKPIDLDVDSSGRVYVLDFGPAGTTGSQGAVTYYSPSSFPPSSATTYARHTPQLLSAEGIGEELRGIGLDPASDRLLVVGVANAIEFGSAGEGSPVLAPEFAGELGLGGMLDVAVCGQSGEVFIASNPGRISALGRDGGERLARIDGRGSHKGTFLSLGANPTIAVDQSNCHLAVFESGRGEAEEYEPSGAFVAGFGAFTDSLAAVPSRVALDNGASSPNRGTAYVAFDDAAPGTHDVSAFHLLSYGEPPKAETLLPSGLGGGQARLNGTVDPRGIEPEECRFEYVTDTEFKATGFAGAQTATCVPSAAQIGAVEGPVEVHADVGGLDPQGRYRYRLVTQNKFGPDSGDPMLFGPPTAETGAAQPVLYREATLRGTVDPAGLASSYHFQYGTAPGQYNQSTPAVELGPGEDPVTVKAALTGLQEGTTYYFRLLVESEAAPSGAWGVEASFPTLQRAAEQLCPNTEYRTSSSAGLPDCRAYELVSPAETRGAQLFASAAGSAEIGFDTWLTPPRGPGAGETLSFFSTITLPGFEGTGYNDGYLAERASGEHPNEGWRSESLSPSFALAGAGTGITRFGASDQRFSFWRIDPVESFPGSLPGGLYLRSDDGEADPLCAPEGGSFEMAACGPLGVDPDATGEFLAAGGQHVIFSSAAHLDPDAPPVPTKALYERRHDGGAGSTRVISLLPDGLPPAGSSTYVGANEVATTILFETGGSLYARLDGEETVEVTHAQGAFAGVSVDGERVFLELPTGLFACDIATTPCPSGAPLAGAGASFVNVAADGERAYFTSQEDLDGAGEGEVGHNNLYLWQAENQAVSFVAALDHQDLVAFGGDQTVTLTSWAKAVRPGTNGGLGYSPTRSTPDGGVLLFQSHAQLTAYENNGKSEVYRYAAGAPAPEQLLCVSCSPGNAPPSADATLQSIRAPGPANSRTRIPNLTDDGEKAFFQSEDRLLPEDANDVQDIYEWKTPGVGGCTRPGGCLALISSGQGEGNSYLFSMSVDGHDVFFSTLEKLVGPDLAGSPSLYDAREDGGIPDPPLPAPCSGDACQGAGSSPPPLPPPTSTGGGNGDLPHGAGKRCPRGKRRVARHGKSRCVSRQKRHHRAPNRSQRTATHHGRGGKRK